MAAAARSTKTETDVAVLQVEVSHIREDVTELKESVKSVHDAIDRNTVDTQQLLKEMSDKANIAHESLNKKISALEKWRYMMMGAGIAIGYFGFEMVGKLLTTLG